MLSIFNRTIQEFSEENKALSYDLSKYDPKITVPLLASLLTLPEYQSNCLRLEILVTLAMAHCRGQKKAGMKQVERWFVQVGESHYVKAEIPAEDVFVSLVLDKQGDYRLLEGSWEEAGFYTQIILDVMNTMPNEGTYIQFKRQVRALLTISDIVCSRSKLQRYQLGSDEAYSTLSSENIPKRSALLSRVTFEFADIEKHGIKRNDLEPFFFNSNMRNSLPEEIIQNSNLNFLPLFMLTDTQFVVVLPSSLSVAVRNYVLAVVTQNSMVKDFDNFLATQYSKLLRETPLLGGLIGTTIRWRRSGEHRWTILNYEADEGHYICFIFFLPSVETHTNGGFLETYQVDYFLHGTLQNLIGNTVTQCEAKSNFKRGLVILVGCGWGMQCEIRPIEPDNPNWYFQLMSVADLVRLSRLEGMSPNYIWCLQDELNAVTNAGVVIENPEGIMNLIGWVRNNDGNIVPDDPIPINDVSPENLLIIRLPTNPLREVRAESDHRYDRHCSLDNTDTWHSVQRESPNLFFTSESSLRLYASLNEVRRGILTCVYEGVLHLWISFCAPNLPQQEIQIQLWQMVTEWFHRIGALFDASFVSSTKYPILRVYVEFCDTGTTTEAKANTSFQGLARLCKIENHIEPNACKIVFGNGFMDGFRIADNFAERLVVRNLAQAFLQLLGVSNDDVEAKKIEGIIVKNNEARFLHAIYAQRFADYVADTLPKKYVGIDKVDFSTAKIGLGWRARNNGQGNTIEGREACTRFLGKVVDVLVGDIIKQLVNFDRRSALHRLVANCESIKINADNWDRTSASLLGLYGETPETVEIAVEQVTKFAHASVASRILIEIALCACPTDGGAKLSDSEMSKLIANTSLLIQSGWVSDSIFYNMIAPEIKISPLGNVLFPSEFRQLVVEPMLARVTGDKFVGTAPLQRKIYEEARVVTDIRDGVCAEFWEAWTTEMGFNPNDALSILGALENEAISNQTAILEISQNKFYSLVCSNSAVTIQAATSFLNQFSLGARKDWKIPPVGFELKDIYPWRYHRKLSYVARPILKTDYSDDPALIIAPAALRRGFAYVFDGVFNGKFKQSFFNSGAMRSWWIKATEGHSFNSNVAQVLLDSQWKVRKNLKVSELLNRKMERDFGDIDILAWKPKGNKILVIECKNLSQALNFSEIAATLSTYRGIEVNGKADNLKKHLNRVSLLKENKEQVGRFTKTQNPNIVSCLICSRTVPMQYARLDALTDTHVGTVEELLPNL